MLKNIFMVIMHNYPTFSARGTFNINY